MSIVADISSEFFTLRRCVLVITTIRPMAVLKVFKIIIMFVLGYLVQLELQGTDIGTIATVMSSFFGIVLFCSIVGFLV